MAKLWLIPCFSLICLLFFGSLGIAIPIQPLPRDEGSGTDSKVSLRILPLGASLTWGLLSPSGNGYRKHLRDQLRYDGWEVNMVGSKSNGNMTDNDVEAHSGDTIDQVKEAAANSVGYKPNVILINAGTNDCRLNVDISNAGDRMRSLIESLINAPDMKDTLIVLSTLIPSEQKETKENRPAVNEQYRNLVTTMRGEGVSIVLADMDPPAPDAGNGWISYPDDFTGEDGVVDDTHPNDEGYAKMAAVWYDAIIDANTEGLIPEPAVASTSIGGGGTCEKSFGDGIYAGGLTQRGSGEDDGIYYHSSEGMGVVFSIYGDEDLIEKIFFARLFSRDKDDILIWDNSGGDVMYNTFQNTGGSTRMFEEISPTSVKDNCNPAGVHFIDINADGLDDFICVGKDGTAYASINNGDGDSPEPPTFTYLGKWKDREGYDQANVRLGDVDGDGRADYCVAAENGDITCWRNGWINNLPEYWQPLGKRFTGKGMGDLRGVRFEDINGDGRDDWLWVDDDGQTTTYTNSRSCVKGQEGDGLNIVWRQGFQKGKSSGPTHPGMGDFASSGLREHIYFARVYGEAQDFGLLGRQDYVFVEKSDNKSELGYTYKFHAWKNVGSGATKIKSDGNRYCNMMGHDDGRMDYVWILSKGDMRIYPNKGLRNFSDDGPSYWDANYVIFDPSSMSIGKDLDRRDLHLVDWDGDGACDIIWTDPSNENRPRLWRNRIKDTGDFNWEYDADPAPDVYCPERKGLGFFDRPVHLADVSGSGKADYLCVEKDGRTWGFVHNDSGWEYIDQFKFAEGKDRANLHWADVNGDGRADLVHTNKFNGDGTVWYNRGRRDIGGSRYWWESVGVKYQGAVAGSCTYFPDLNGDGLADMHSIKNSLDNTAETWYNGCKGKDHTGDDGPLEDPNLPVMPQQDDPLIHYTDGSCGQAEMMAIRTEFRYARDMAKEAQKRVQFEGYYDRFIPEEVRDPAKATEIFGRIAELLGGNGGHHFYVVCHPNTEICSDPDMLASMNDKEKTMNLCPQFFTDTRIVPAKDRLNECGTMTLREAHRSRAVILIHECTHTNYAMTGEITGRGMSLDYAYGYNSCIDLADGKFDRSCTPYGQSSIKKKKTLCGETKEVEGICDKSFSATNADSWAFIAAGVYYSVSCKKTIPHPIRTTAESSCPNYDDYVLLDEYSILGISKYVHFGDSYAAGMGTSVTSGDSCRRGGNNYGSLLKAWLDSEIFEFQNLACSGDTVVGLNRQIDEWIKGDPASTTIATLTLGGNDIGFADLKDCVLTPFFSSAAEYREACLKAEDNALALIEDVGENGLGWKLRTAYKRIMDGANLDFHLYVPGYVGFFNHDTEDCDNSTFYYWSPRYDTIRNDDLVYLTRDFRREMNDLVQRLNDLISEVVLHVNNDLGAERIHYVNMQPYFDGHRWCEEGNFHEPDSYGKSYFFLSGWPDILRDIYSAESINTTEADELNSLVAAGSIKLPDPNTCRDSLGTNPDPYAVAMCDIAVDVKEDPDGLESQRLERANKAIADGDYSNQDIGWYLPTSQVKTFHPRSPGMALYREAVISAMKASGQFPWWA